MSNSAAYTPAALRQTIQRIEALLERVGAMASSLFALIPRTTITRALAVAPAASVAVGSIDVSAVDTAFAVQVQFVSEDPTANQADSARFTVTVQGDPAAPVATTTTALVVQAGNMAVAPTYTVAIVGTTLVASVTNNGANPINVLAKFYVDIQS